MVGGAFSAIVAKKRAVDEDGLKSNKSYRMFDSRVVFAHAAEGPNSYWWLELCH